MPTEQAGRLTDAATAASGENELRAMTRRLTRPEGVETSLHRDFEDASWHFNTAAVCVTNNNRHVASFRITREMLNRTDWIAIRRGMQQAVNAVALDAGLDAGRTPLLDTAETPVGRLRRIVRGLNLPDYIHVDIEEEQRRNPFDEDNPAGIEWEDIRIRVSRPRMSTINGLVGAPITREALRSVHAMTHEFAEQAGDASLEQTFRVWTEPFRIPGTNTARAANPYIANTNAWAIRDDAVTYDIPVTDTDHDWGLTPQTYATPPQPAPLTELALARAVRTLERHRDETRRYAADTAMGLGFDPLNVGPDVRRQVDAVWAQQDEQEAREDVIDRHMLRARAIYDPHIDEPMPVYRMRDRWAVGTYPTPQAATTVAPVATTTTTGATFTAGFRITDEMARDAAVTMAGATVAQVPRARTIGETADEAMAYATERAIADEARAYVAERAATPPHRPTPPLDEYGHPISVAFVSNAAMSEKLHAMRPR